MENIVMNDGSELDFDNNYGNVIRFEKPKCEKGCFDSSWLKKKDKIYIEFNIPLSEQIVAF